MRTLSLLENTKIIVINYEGELRMDDLIKDVRIDLTHYVGNQPGGAIIDFTHAKLLFGPHDIHELISVFKEYDSKISHLRVAVILNLPIPTATMLLLGETISTSKIGFRVFSTMEAARSWLMAVFQTDLAN